MTKENSTQNKWYECGLAFECHQCGDCCSGPGEGYVWVTRKDISLIAKHQGYTPDEFEKKFVRKVGKRYSLIEKKPSHDCIFLSRNNGKISCDIYSVRPIQCRTWPFWPENLHCPDSWNLAAQDCQGMNKGRLYDFESIQAIRKGKLETGQFLEDPCKEALQWIQKNLTNRQCIKAIENIYKNLDETVAQSGGLCENSGKCCQFKQYGHRLYITTLEMLYFVKGLQKEQKTRKLPYIKTSEDGSCPYQINQLCSTRSYRPAGCRIYFCQGCPDDKQNEMTEDVLENLRQLHLSFDVPYFYGDWLNWLKNYQTL